jgi:cytochrome c-type protein NapC
MDTNPPSIKVSASDRPVMRQRERKRFLSISVVVAFVLGTVFMGVFNMVLDHTNSEEFCISCHEMKDTVYHEYQATIHNTNRTGVRAVCADCHVSKAFFPKLLQKIGATNDLWHTMQGTIDTPEKFEAKRAELAQRVWQRMKANDSQECRNCHKAEFFDTSVQKSQRGIKEHQEELITKKQTCIDCHKGIAHQEPEIPEISQADSPGTTPSGGAQE